MNDIQNTPARSSKHLGRYLLWALWNTLGFSLALPAVFLFSITLGYIIMLINPKAQGSPMEAPEVFLLNTLQVMIIGLVIALCQGLPLGFRKIQLALWVVVNTLAWSIFIGLGLGLELPPELSPSNLWAGTALRGIEMGLLIGIPQGFLMQKTNRNAWWWVFASTLGGIGGFAVGVSYAKAILESLGEDPNIALFAVLPLFGFVSSTISGLFLLRPIRWFEPRTAD